MPNHEVSEAVRTVVEDPNRDALIEKVSSKMADVFGTGDDDTVIDADVKPSTEEAVPVVEDKPAEEAATTEEKPAEEKPVVAAEKGQEKPTTPLNPAADVIAVPAAYRRSLKAYEWSDEEIDQAAKANPDGFLKMAQKIHTSRVDQTKQWADLGRQQKNQQPATPKVADKPVDIAAMRVKYGDEPFIDVLEAQQKQLEVAQTFIEQSRQRQVAQEIEGLTRQVDGYFGSKEMEPYHEHYGKSGQTLSEKQIAERQKVLETADLLISGARAQGRPITLDEALTLAHDSVSSPIAAKVAVKKIETQVKARQNQITLRPGTRAAASKPADRKDLEGKVKTGLAAIFK